MPDSNLQSPAAGLVEYAERLQRVLENQNWEGVARLADLLRGAWREDRGVFVCGNGGSAANANHWANDFTFPVARGKRGVRITALTANEAVMSCLANDVGYEQVFAYQLRTLARAGDVLIVLSGSGNSPNIIEALGVAREIGMRTAGILGFSGGRALPLVEIGIHINVDDMQIAEDLQIVVNHMLMRELGASGSYA